MRTATWLIRSALSRDMFNWSSGISRTLNRLVRQTSRLFPYTTLFRSVGRDRRHLTRVEGERPGPAQRSAMTIRSAATDLSGWCGSPTRPRSEEHTSELQSRRDLVCRLLLEKKNHSVHAYSHVANQKRAITRHVQLELGYLSYFEQTGTTDI